MNVKLNTVSAVHKAKQTTNALQRQREAFLIQNTSLCDSKGNDIILSKTPSHLKLYKTHKVNFSNKLLKGVQRKTVLQSECVLSDNCN